MKSLILSLKFWFFLQTGQYGKAEKFANKYAKRGYGVALDGWIVRRIADVSHKNSK